MQPAIQGFFDPVTSTVSYVVHAAGAEECAIIDPVLDFDPAAARTSTGSVDACQAPSAVTSTSSSIRMPMPRNRSGASS